MASITNTGYAVILVQNGKVVMVLWRLVSYIIH